MTKKEEILKYVEENNIKLTSEQENKLNSLRAMTDEELDAVSGGGGCSLSTNPTCPSCGESIDTYSEWNPIPTGVCRKCGHMWHL